MSAHDGYVYLSVDGKLYLAHRLAWFYVHGEWPAEDVDHRDTVRHHNWLTNLRPATRGENMQNVRSARVDSRTGLLGVVRRADRETFGAEIQLDGRKTRLGEHGTAQAAHATYLAAKAVAHPFQTLVRVAA